MRTIVHLSTGGLLSVQLLNSKCSGGHIVLTDRDMPIQLMANAGVINAASDAPLPSMPDAPRPRPSAALWSASLGR
ncbi:hypothetical protein GCM10009730_58840 [Streptomyces albidochromogenes]